ncbi:MAG TPA: Flp pilus assembly protein CpaB [Verrucomicrobiae bacterium]|nr:Flp pilus assembly protein CpaB [Verrucomicrobiae bacterium]
MAKKSGAGGIILIAVVLAIAAIYLVWNMKRQQDLQSEKYWTEVVTALQDIPARTKITREMITLTRYPKELVIDGVIRNPQEADGHTTLVRIKAKEQIRTSDLLGQGQAPGLAFDIPPGMRAIAIGAGEVMAAGSSVKPGDRVDILATYTDPVAHQETTQMILQNVLVLAVNEGVTDQQGKQGAKSSMTLAVKPEEAELLTAADRAGALRVALRGINEKAVIASQGVGTRDFLGPNTLRFSTTAPDTLKSTPIIISPPRNQRPEIKVYRGSQETTVPQE